MDKIKTSLVELDNIPMGVALSKISDMSKTKGIDIVVTPNIDHLGRLLNKNSHLTSAYENASLCLCDSRIFEKLLRLKGKKVKEVIPGSTLTSKLFDTVLSPEDHIMVIGGNESIIKKLRTKYARLNIDHYNPPMGFINDIVEVNKVLEITSFSKANYFFLAIGSPRQEALALKMKECYNNHAVALCIGASILFLVGEEKRAPLWMQEVHCEWLYRLLQDPKRLFFRYFQNLTYLVKIYKRL